METLSILENGIREDILTCTVNSKHVEIYNYEGKRYLVSYLSNVINQVKKIDYNSLQAIEINQFIENEIEDAVNNLKECHAVLRLYNSFFSEKSLKDFNENVKQAEYFENPFL